MTTSHIAVTLSNFPKVNKGNGMSDYGFCFVESVLFIIS